MSRDTVIRILKELHLPGMRRHLDEVAARATANAMGNIEFLHELLLHEEEGRRISRTERLMRNSRLPPQKNLENFELKRLGTKLQQQVRTLLEGAFVDRAENVLAFGNPGAGKTHLLCAVAQELIHKGRRVLFQPCNLLVQDLLRAKQTLSMEKLLKKLGRYDAIVLDDIGYVQQSREEMEVLFTFIADRYERTSLLLTSNLPFSKWEKIFKDPMTTAAAIDRLVHHCVILEMNTESYRMEEAAKRRTKTA